MGRVKEIAIDVCELFHDGYSAREIAEKLKMSIGDVLHVLVYYYDDFNEEL